MHILYPVFCAITIGLLASCAPRSFNSDTTTKENSLSNSRSANAFELYTPPSKNIVKSITESGGYVTYNTGSDEKISASIGRWDTPYPNPDSGESAPGLEPNGTSSLAIEVEVNSGGIATFDYSLRTYDAGEWDWLDISLVTPEGSKRLVSKLGKPGQQYGNYWVSPTVPLKVDLEPYIGQTVRFVFSVVQDGWGDQTSAIIRNFDVKDPCSVPGIPALTDATAISFENGKTIDVDGLTDEMKTGLQCLQDAITDAGGTSQLKSAYRPSEYQSHLRDVWGRWDDLKEADTAACERRKADIRQEMEKHELLKLKTLPAGPSGPHTQGRAIDVSFDVLWLPNQNIDTMAAGCNLWRPLPIKDKVHFVLRGER